MNNTKTFELPPPRFFRKHSQYIYIYISFESSCKLSIALQINSYSPRESLDLPMGYEIYEAYHCPLGSHSSPGYSGKKKIVWNLCPTYLNISRLTTCLDIKSMCNYTCCKETWGMIIIPFQNKTQVGDQKRFKCRNVHPWSLTWNLKIIP